MDSRFGAVVEPYVRAVYDVAPRADPPADAVTYAHHPPLQVLMAVVSTGVLGDSVAALRVPGLLVGAATAVFMASLLRGRGLAWGPTLLAVAAMASTGFYYVYARISVSFSLLLAAIAAVSWALRRADVRGRDALVVAGLAALAAMQSWIGIAAMGLVMLWLLAARRDHGGESPPGGAEQGLGANDAEPSLGAEQSLGAVDAEQGLSARARRRRDCRCTTAMGAGLVATGVAAVGRPAAVARSRRGGHGARCWRHCAVDAHRRRNPGPRGPGGHTHRQ